MLLSTLFDSNSMWLYQKSTKPLQVPPNYVMLFFDIKKRWKNGLDNVCDE